MTHWPWNAIAVLAVLFVANVAFVFVGWQHERHRKPTPRPPDEHARLHADIQAYLDHTIHWDDETDYEE